MKPSPRRILVPTDLSPFSDHALGLAKELAGPFKAEIHLLHVRTVIDSPIVSPEDAGEIERILAPSDARAKQDLEAMVDGADVPISCRIVRGITPVAAILDAIAELRCDLVVMGTQGRLGLKGMLMGSVAREVVHRSPVPVLTTRAVVHSGKPPQRILVAYDTSGHSLEAVSMAADWARLLSSEVTLLYVLEPAVYPDFYAPFAPREEQLNKITGACRTTLEEIAKEHLRDVAHEISVIRGQAADGIADFAADGGFDLVVLATRGLSGISHALFGSVAERVTQLSEAPVLTVRGQGGEARSATRGGSRTGKRTRPSKTDSSEPSAFDIEHRSSVTVLRFRQREALAGVDLGVVSGLWDLLEGQTRDPKPVLLAIAPPDLLGPRNLDRMIGTPTDWEGPTASEISARIIREENVIQRFIKAIRGLRSYVIGAVDGEIALHLAAPLLACDYRIVGSEAVFVNVIDRCPRAPLGGIPWLLTKMVGSAAATHILLDQPSLSATEALELGLVNHIVEPGGLDKASLEIAERFGSFHAEALIALKQAAAASPDELASYLRQESTLVERLAFPGRSRVRMMEE